MSSGPELLKAKENLRNIEHQLKLMQKTHNSLSKKELTKNTQVLLDQVDESLTIINKEIEEFSKNILGHRNYVETKSEFLKRHYSRKKA